MIRVGIGKDSHRFISEGDDTAAGKPLIIGGVIINEMPPFKAHSDGDVVYHALFNAVSSALGKRSIGYYFPDSNPAEMGQDSSAYLKKALKLLREANVTIQNISIVVECAKPKIEPLVEAMTKNISSLLSVSESTIGITATSGEDVTPWGMGLGVEVTALVTIT